MSPAAGQTRFLRSGSLHAGDGNNIRIPTKAYEGCDEHNWAVYWYPPPRRWKASNDMNSDIATSSRPLKSAAKPLPWEAECPSCCRRLCGNHTRKRAPMARGLEYMPCVAEQRQAVGVICACELDEEHDSVTQTLCELFYLAIHEGYSSGCFYPCAKRIPVYPPYAVRPAFSAEKSFLNSVSLMLYHAP